MVQQLNPEFIPKIKASIEELEGNTVPSIRKGMDNILVHRSSSVAESPLLKVQPHCCRQQQI